MRVFSINLRALFMAFRIPDKLQANRLPGKITKNVPILGQFQKK